MSLFDIIIIAIAIASFVYGLFKGFVKELAGLVGVMIGIYVAIHFGHFAESLLEEHVPGGFLGVTAFALTLVVIVVGVHFLAILVDKLINITVLSLPNRIFGGLFSMLKMMFFLSCILYVIDFFFDGQAFFLGDDDGNSSFTYGPLSGLAPAVFPYLNFGLGQLTDM